MSDLTSSHRTLWIVLRQDGRPGCLDVACIDPLFIHGPIQWRDAQIIIDMHGNDGFLVTDSAADVRIITGSVEVAEHV